MSVYSLTKGSEHALKLLALTGGNDTLLLIQPAREIRAEIQVQPAAEQKLEAALRLREQRHSMTLQTGDSANAQHLADWVEAIANGTLDTAQAIHQRQSVLLPCCRCEGEAIAYCYLAPAPAQHDLHGVKCRHRDCQSLEGVATAAAAADAWNAIQREELAEVAEPAPAQDDQYPPCDYCGVIPDHHPWHGSGMFNGEDSPHIHACNDCRHLLPTRPAQTEQQPVAHVAGAGYSGIDTANPKTEWMEIGVISMPLQGRIPLGAKLYLEPISQTAPLPDEQAAFDAWYVTPEAFKAGDRDGWRGIAWAAWQARAALASAPAA